MDRLKDNDWRSSLKPDVMTTKSFVEILTINFKLPCTNEKSLTINISTSEDNAIMKMSPLSAIYLCHSVVLTLLLTAVQLSLTASDKDSNIFLYYLLAIEDLSQDEITF